MGSQNLWIVGRYLFFLRATSFLLFISIAPKASHAEGANLEAQISEIVAPRDGIIRKWTYAPKITLIQDGSIELGQVQRITDQVQNSVHNFPGFSSIESFNISPFSSEILGNSRVRYVVARRGESMARLTAIEFSLPDGRERVFGDIFFIVAQLQSVVTLGVLASDDLESLREMAQGTQKYCFASVYSSENVINSAFVFINAADEESISRCLYEGTLKSLGLTGALLQKSLYGGFTW